MPNEAKVKSGDWVRFQQNGKLVVGVVGYVRDRAIYPYVREAVTDLGSVNLDDVLEVRGPTP